jgi:hypothetical protein
MHILSGLILNGIYGLIVSYIWTFALGYHPTRSTLIYGVIIASLWIAVKFKKTGDKIGGDITENEASFAIGIQSTFFLVVAIGGGLAIWLVRLIFF